MAKSKQGDVAVVADAHSAIKRENKDIFASESLEKLHLMKNSKHKMCKSNQSLSFTKEKNGNYKYFMRKLPQTGNFTTELHRIPSLIVSST